MSNIVTLCDSPPPTPKPPGEQQAELPATASTLFVEFYSPPSLPEGNSEIAHKQFAPCSRTRSTALQVHQPISDTPPPPLAGHPPKVSPNIFVLHAIYHPHIWTAKPSSKLTMHFNEIGVRVCARGGGSMNIPSVHLLSAAGVAALPSLCLLPPW